MMTSRRWIAAVVLTLSAVPAFAERSAVAGRIKTASGAVFIVRAGGEPLPAQIGQEIFETDGLKTGADGHLGVTLKDDTRVSLGPDTEVRVQAFKYAPGEGRLALVLKFVRGVTAYVSGRIAKLSPDAVRLETPAAIVGVRGTTVVITVLSE